MRFRTFAALAALVIGCGPAAAQWTNLPPGPNARIVYVSSSTGADGNSGLSPTTPKATLAAGFALLRNGQGDHLWLRRGDTFALTSTLLWTKSGASAVEPMVLGTYGTGARPIIDPGGGEAIHITPGFQSANTVRHVAVIGIHFRSAVRDFTQPNFNLATVTPSAVAIRVVGVQTTAPQIVENLLIEDCKSACAG